MLGADGGARIDKHDHLHRRRAQTSRGMTQGGLSAASRGQGNGQRNWPPNHRFDVPSRTVTLSSLVSSKAAVESVCASGQPSPIVPHKILGEHVDEPRKSEVAAPSGLPCCMRAQLSDERHGASNSSPSLHQQRRESLHGCSSKRTLYRGRHHPLARVSWWCVLNDNVAKP